MIYVIKNKLNDNKPYCITGNLEFAKFIIETECKNLNECYLFECNDIHDVALLVSKKYLKSVEMFYATL